MSDMELLTVAMSRDSVANAIPIILTNLRNLVEAIKGMEDSRDIRVWREFGLPAMERAIASLEELGWLIHQLPFPLHDGTPQVEGEQLAMELPVAEMAPGEEGEGGQAY
jgi:hypothetical protein